MKLYPIFLVTFLLVVSFHRNNCHAQEQKMDVCVVNINDTVVYRILKDVMEEDSSYSFFSDTMYYVLSYMEDTVLEDFQIPGHWVDYASCGYIKSGSVIYTISISGYLEPRYYQPDYYYFALIYKNHIILLNNIRNPKILNKKLFNPSLSTITIPVPEGKPFEDDRARQHSYVIGNDMFLKMRRYFR